MRKNLLFLLFLSTSCFATQVYNCPQYINCEKNQCYAGMRYDDRLEIQKQANSYPYFYPEGKYVFSASSAQIDNTSKYSPGMVTCLYRKEDFPSVNFIIYSSTGFYADINNGKGWNVNTGQPNIATCDSTKLTSDCDFMYK